MKYQLTLSFSLLLLFSCSNKKKTPDKSIVADSTNVQAPVLVSEEKAVLNKTKEIMAILKNKEFQQFTQFIHPVLGIRFSPYAYIDTLHDLKLTKSAFEEHVKKQDKLNWGSYDPSDEPINKSIQGYFKEFVYDADFLHAEKTSFNEFIGGGNTLNNLLAIYKDCVFTESHFSGFDKKFEGMDWTSVRLVYKKQGEQYYLVGIVHDQWTI